MARWPAAAGFGALAEVGTGLDAISLTDLGMRDARDQDIFQAARAAGAVIISKDSDFVDLVQRLGAPPKLVWLTCGNVTTARLKALCAKGWPNVAALLAAGEAIVELGDWWARDLQRPGHAKTEVADPARSRISTAARCA